MIFIAIPPAAEEELFNANALHGRHRSLIPYISVERFLGEDVAREAWKRRGEVDGEVDNGVSNAIGIEDGRFFDRNGFNEAVNIYNGKATGAGLQIISASIRKKSLKTK